MFEPVIGLEVHLALRTTSKLFCGCAAEGFGLEPNTNVCPVCLGLPGTLPVANQRAIELATTFALALDCEVDDVTRFHRKHYFYPDAPKNYQISQYDEPIGQHGRITLGNGRSFGITRCHLEEDAGRLVHPPYAAYSLVDFNRVGAPLIEMVTEPDLRSADDARELLTEIRALARALGVSDASPDEGKLRADVNISLRRPGAEFGTKVEVKNLNSFRNVAAAIEYEIKRQSQLLDDGRSIVQETRGFNEGGQRTYSLRSKEGSADYRYLADPDLPEVTMPPERRRLLVSEMPELPAAKRGRLVKLGLKEDMAQLIAYDVDVAAFFDEARAAYDGPPQNLANWLTGEVAGLLSAGNGSLAESTLTPARLAKLLMLLDDGSISTPTAKELLPAVIEGRDPGDLVAERGLQQVSDESEVERLVVEVLDANPELVARVAANPKAVNALLGAVMKASGGRAKPDLVRMLLSKKLGV